MRVISTVFLRSGTWRTPKRCSMPIAPGSMRPPAPCSPLPWHGPESPMGQPLMQAKHRSGVADFAGGNQSRQADGNRVHLAVQATVPQFQELAQDWEFGGSFVTLPNRPLDQ